MARSAYGLLAVSTRMFLEVAEGSAAARALYHRQGFAAVGRRPDYYPDGSHALVLSRTLTQPR